MYFYIYDTFLAEKRFERELSAVESRLTDLGLTGKIGRLTPFTNARGLIRDEMRRGAQTIVAVGNDETVAKVIDGLGDSPVTLGIIPVGGPNEIAESLGVPVGPEACEVLSRRVTKRLDLGSANGHYFLSDVRMSGKNFVIETEGKFKMSPQADECDLLVCNMRNRILDDHKLPENIGDPLDGHLDLVLITRRLGFMNRLRGKFEEVTTMPISKITITSPEQFDGMSDGRKFSAEALTVEIVADKVKVIIGRDRTFGEEE